MKTRLVIFTETGARILKGVDPEQYRGMSNMLINPEIPQGVPPHHWKVDGGKLIEMSEEEKAYRDGLLQIAPAHPEQITLVKPIRWYHYLLMFLGSAAVATLVQLVLFNL